MGTQLPSPKQGAELPQIFGPSLLWPNGWMDEAGIGMVVGLSPCDSVLDGDPAPPHKGGGAPSLRQMFGGFGPFLLWPNGWMHKDATWHGGRPQPRRLWVRWGPSPPPKRQAEAGGRVPQFAAHGYCGRTAGRIKMTLGMEVGNWSSPHCARWGHSSPPQNRGQSSLKFSAHLCCGQTAGWMKTPLGTEVDLGPGHIVLDGVPSPTKGAHQPPLFGPCLLWPRSPISATAELLSTQQRKP